MKRPNPLSISALLALLATSALGHDFSVFDYRNVGPVRGGRVTAVAGTVAAQPVCRVSAPANVSTPTSGYGTMACSARRSPAARRSQAQAGGSGWARADRAA